MKRGAAAKPSHDQNKMMSKGEGVPLNNSAAARFHGQRHEAINQLAAGYHSVSTHCRPALGQHLLMAAGKRRKNRKPDGGGQDGLPSSPKQPASPPAATSPTTLRSPRKGRAAKQQQEPAGPPAAAAGEQPQIPLGKPPRQRGVKRTAFAWAMVGAVTACLTMFYIQAGQKVSEAPHVGAQPALIRAGPSPLSRTCIHSPRNMCSCACQHAQPCVPPPPSRPNIKHYTHTCRRGHSTPPSHCQGASSTSPPACPGLWATHNA